MIVMPFGKDTTLPKQKSIQKPIQKTLLSIQKSIQKTIMTKIQRKRMYTYTVTANLFLNDE